MNFAPPPVHARRIVLVNPTRYLGNLLIAGGLIQAFAAHSHAQGRAFTVVVDAAFVDLLRPALPETTALLAYPRGAIKAAGAWRKLTLYLGFLRQLRALKADIAFNIEEDSTSDRLTRHSGAAYRLGCSTTRHRGAYEAVVPISFVARPLARRHRWYSFMEMFAALGLQEPPQAGYLHFPPGAPPLPDVTRLQEQGFDPKQPYAALHAGATKDYKKWPRNYFAQLARRLRDAGLQVVFIGAGRDAHESAQVFELLGHPRQGIFDVTNHFSLSQLGGFLRGARCMVGNDSGPFHLATALGVKGVVIFGPTDVGLWRPLGEEVRVLQHSAQCSPECSRKRCLFDHACLKSISPDEVMAALYELSALH
ncbi:MAG: glycosyltransferase family 9 protein [Pseudomonadales bacterium]|nr:glycosyltransferase family 9 protein [Pseudomonadales bacterium]